MQKELPKVPGFLANQFFCECLYIRKILARFQPNFLRIESRFFGSVETGWRSRGETIRIENQALEAFKPPSPNAGSDSGEFVLLHVSKTAAVRFHKL